MKANNDAGRAISCGRASKLGCIKQRMESGFGLAAVSVVLCATNANAQWSNTVNQATSWPAATNFVGGATVTINTPKDLARFAWVLTQNTPSGQMSANNCPVNFLGWTVRLNANLDMGAHQWTAAGVGDASPRNFRGTFDGGSHTISGLYKYLYEQAPSTATPASSPVTFGLFARIQEGSLVKDLNLRMNQYTVYYNAPNVVFGGIAGRVHGGIVDNCMVSGTNHVHTGFYNAPWNASVTSLVGGIAGLVGDGGIIRNCTSDLQLYSKAKHAYGAGIVARAEGNATVKNCLNMGTAPGRDGAPDGVGARSWPSQVGTTYPAGIVANVATTNADSIANFLNTGLVGKYNDGAGGIPAAALVGAIQHAPPGMSPAGNVTLANLNAAHLFWKQSSQNPDRPLGGFTAAQATGVTSVPNTGVAKTNALNALNAWVDARNAAEGVIYRHWVIVPSINGGYPILGDLPPSTTPEIGTPLTGTFEVVRTHLYADYDARSEADNGPQVIATFIPTSPLPPDFPVGITVTATSPLAQLPLRVELQNIGGAWQVVVTNRIGVTWVRSNYRNDSAWYNLSLTVGENTYSTNAVLRVDVHPTVTLRDDVLDDAANVAVGTYSPGDDLYDDAATTGHGCIYPPNVQPEGTPVTIVLEGGPTLSAVLGEPVWALDVYRPELEALMLDPLRPRWVQNIYADIPPYLSGLYNATVYIGGISDPVWIYRDTLGFAERAPYQFTFQRIIYAEMYNQSPGNYRPEWPPYSGWDIRPVNVTFENYAYGASLVPLNNGSGFARIVFNGVVDESAVRGEPYTLTNTVAIAPVPRPDHVGASDEFIRIYKKPTIVLNDPLKPDDGTNQIGTFTPPTSGGYPGDTLPPGGEMLVEFNIFHRGTRDLYVDPIPGRIVREGSATTYKMIVDGAWPIIPPGDWDLAIAPVVDDYVTQGREFTFAFSVPYAAIMLRAAVSAGEADPIIGAYIPVPGYDFGTITDFAVEITATLGATMVTRPGFIDAQNNVHLRGTVDASLIGQSFDVIAKASGVFADGKTYLVAFNNQTATGDGSDNHTVDILPGPSDLRILAIKVYTEQDDEWVEIEVDGCTHYGKGYALFGDVTLLARRDPANLEIGLTPGGVRGDLRYYPTKDEITNLGFTGGLRGFNPTGGHTFKFRKPAEEKHFFHLRELP